MKTTSENCFSNGSEHCSWVERNCHDCIKQSHYKEKTDTYTAFKCTIDRDIQMQIIGLKEISLKSWEITQLMDCPNKTTERKKTFKKRKLLNHFTIDFE
jgi:hypothetical protein